MSYIPRTPFRRAYSAAVKVRPELSPDRPVPIVADKWKVLRNLATARKDFGLSDRDITVLQVLLSFHKSTELDLHKDLVVHPSNATICDRLNGMPNSTMRRHIARLVDTGIITRRDSPNGKRYVRRSAGTRIAYGFDLAPFVQRSGEFALAATTVQTAEAKIKALREAISLMRRDLLAYIETGQIERPDLPLWDQLSDLTALTTRALRRKLSDSELNAITSDLQTGLTQADLQLGNSKTNHLSTTPAQNEHHCQTSKRDTNKEGDGTDSAFLKEVIRFNEITAACKEVQSYAEDPIQDWQSLGDITTAIRPMIGISDKTWKDALRWMGPVKAAAVVALILERLNDIRFPDGYLRRLVREAEQGTFRLATLLRTVQGKQNISVGSQL